MIHHRKGTKAHPLEKNKRYPRDLEESSSFSSKVAELAHSLGMKWTAEFESQERTDGCLGRQREATDTQCLES